MSQIDRGKRQGIVYTAVAFFAWGLLPIYWKALDAVPALEILAHRIIWSFVLTVCVLLVQGKSDALRLLSKKDNRRSLLLTSGLIGTNWFIYIYAVNSDRIVEASLGYYSNPLLSVMLGILVLKERLNLMQVIAFLLACSGVIYLTVDYGRFPWIAVVLACAFALYGLLKKTTDIEPMDGLMVETMFLAPAALAVILYQAATQRGALLTLSPQVDLLLIFAGAVTTLPLYWFTRGARRIRLSSVGFLQYIAPTLMLFIGIFLYRESFTAAHFVSFGLVWAGLFLYTLSLMRGAKA
ncbi:EamA family transporter RarD [candidate division WOR-3 bacterium]|nr:EamA family transporter RarD [candidate division WOR-3 bacterium]